MRIMFIDDERRRMRVYIEELEDNSHEVFFFDNVTSALDALRSPSESFDLIVVDISMPSGTEYRFEDTNGGTRTGMILYDTIRNLRPDAKVVIFTNVSDHRVAERFAKEDAKLCCFARKPDKLPFQFVRLVEDFVSK